MKIVIAGGTGFIGGAVTKRLLDEGHEVVLLSRRAAGSILIGDKKTETVFWDGRTGGPWRSKVEAADAVINFCGESIAGRYWTKRQKELLRQSRILPTRLLAQAIGDCREKSKIFVNASAVGFYGDGEDRILDEKDEKGSGFLADLCAAWENEAFLAQKDGVRVVAIRMGLVLGRGGVLQKMVPPFRFFAGGPLGSGSQWISWISARDLADAVLFCLSNRNISGAVNCVSPNPVSMKDFCGALGRALGRPSWFRVPSWMLRLALGEMSEVLLKSQRAVPAKLSEAGFCLRDTKIYESLAGILNDSV